MACFITNTCICDASLYQLLGMIYFWAALILGIGYLLSGFILAKQYSVNNARLVLKVSVFYLPILFLTIMVDKLT